MKCLSCNANNFQDILDLGYQPWCGDFLEAKDVGTESVYPLKLIYCNNCTLLQLSHRVPKETMFQKHLYLSGTTKTLTKHFYDTALENVLQFKLTDKHTVLDIGGNDGTQLLQYKKHGITKLINVESASNISKISETNGIQTYNNFFNLEFCKKHLKPSSIKLINASGVFFHLEELQNVVAAIEYLLEDGGVFVAQFMYAGDMLDNLTFDMIYHEHLCYYTINSFSNLFKNTSLSLHDISHSSVHSGTIIAKLIKNSKVGLTNQSIPIIEQDNTKYTLDYIKTFAEKIQSKRNNLKIFLTKLKDEKKLVYAYGAPVKGCTLLNYLGIDKSLIIKAIEINPLKIGKFMPGSHIPIELENDSDLPDYYLLLSHNFKEEILTKNAELIKKGIRFIIPFPDISVI